MTNAIDLLTLDEGKRLLSQPSANTNLDEELGFHITTVSRRLDELCGPVVNRAITGELYDGGVESIRLRHAPVSAFTTVTEYRHTTPQVLTAETNASKTANNYIYDAVTKRIYRRTSGCSTCFPHGRLNIVLTYTAGRAANTDAVDEKFKRAAGIVLAHLWRTDMGSGNRTFGDYPTGFAIPNRALELLSSEIYGPLAG